MSVGPVTAERATGGERIIFYNMACGASERANQGSYVLMHYQEIERANEKRTRIKWEMGEGCIARPLALAAKPVEAYKLFLFLVKRALSQVRTDVTNCVPAPTTFGYM